MGEWKNDVGGHVCCQRTTGMILSPRLTKRTIVCCVVISGLKCLPKFVVNDLMYSCYLSSCMR